MTLYRSVSLWILFITLSIGSVHSSDSFTQQFKYIGFHLGTLTEFYDAIQVDDQGTTDKFAINPLIGFSLDIEITPQWTWAPELNWVLPREAGEGITKNIIMIRNDAIWRASDIFRLRVGTSFMINNMRGEGGSRRLNNGSGTSEFYVPSESRTSINNTLDLGAEVLMDEFAFRFQTYIYSLLKSERRQISYSLTLTYYYDMGK
jgi:hypothetical protein